MLFPLKRSISFVILVSILLILLTGCTLSGISSVGAWSATPAPLPTHPLYVLARGNGPNYQNELIIMDADNWQITRRTLLLDAGPWHLSQDPQGRIWVGYGARPGNDHRVQVFSPQGKLLQTFVFDNCSDPYTPARFSAGRAFIPCLQTGFSGMVLVLDLVSLEAVNTLEIRSEDDFFLIGSIGTSEKYLLVAGGGNQGRLMLFDLDTFQRQELIITLQELVLLSVLPYQGRFLLVNGYPTSQGNMFVVDPAAPQKLSVQPLPAPAALWAVIDHNTLYSYHSPEMVSEADASRIVGASYRAVSRFNLETGEGHVWPLPDDWPGRYIAVVNGKIILAASGPVGWPDGLYELDPDSGELTQVLELNGAFHLLAPGE